MKTKKTIYRLVLLAAASVVITWTMAYAASRQDQQSQRQRQQGQQPTQQQRMQQQGRQQGQQQRAQGRRVVIDPETWIRVGYDFDNDGQTDAYEYIMGYDLRMARTRSAKRQGRPDNVAGQLRQQRTVRGTIEDMKQIKLAGVQQEHVLVKISSQGRTVRADLGAKNQIDQLNIQKGDQITVKGVPGSINNKQMINGNRRPNPRQKHSCSPGKGTGQPQIRRNH